MEAEGFLADPQKLRAEAQKEPRRRCLGDYRDTIRLLKDERGFSFREIAAWLGEREVDADHNAVWRVYSSADKQTRAPAGAEQSERTEQAPSKEAAMPWMDGA
ncbi:MAG TPA: hypothetical protein PK751_12885 [Verrucomicrobiota bacterium]|jgi:hypothetical protein|nr:hypothetical protein [Verrucomicrobiota bacterium]HPW93267.1 hypothetical protein [Verrucomicrobiota bacterium]HQB74030.1 hypothetical protein [Verrucomicrobiota bacterium]